VRRALTWTEIPLRTEVLREAARTLAPYYGKVFGTLTATGMAAIEVGLEWVGVRPEDEVVVPSECCYLVPAAIRRLGAVPVFALVDDRLTLDPLEIHRVLTVRTRAVLAVHHLGLPCPVRALRMATPTEIPIIEDAAQAFDLRSEGAAVGSTADIVVTSFGEGKPLSLMGGGGVFASQQLLENAMDRHTAAAREGTTLPRSSALHPRAVEDLEAHIKAAHELIARRRKAVARLTPLLHRAGLRPWRGRLYDSPSWHRLPVWAQDAAARENALMAVSAEKVVQLPHATSVPQLMHFKEHTIVLSPQTFEELLLIRLDDHERLEEWACDVRRRGHIDE